MTPPLCIIILHHSHCALKTFNGGSGSGKSLLIPPLITCPQESRDGKRRRVEAAGYVNASSARSSISYYMKCAKKQVWFESTLADAACVDEGGWARSGRQIWTEYREGERVCDKKAESGRALSKAFGSSTARKLWHAQIAVSSPAFPVLPTTFGEHCVTFRTPSRRKDIFQTKSHAEGKLAAGALRCGVKRRKRGDERWL